MIDILFSCGLTMIKANRTRYHVSVLISSHTCTASAGNIAILHSQIITGHHCTICAGMHVHYIAVRQELVTIVLHVYLSRKNVCPAQKMVSSILHVQSFADANMSSAQCSQINTGQHCTSFVFVQK